MLLHVLIAFFVFAAAAFAVQRTSRAAEKPGRWSRNGLLGIATISMLIMAAAMQRDPVLAFSLLLAWLPGMTVGLLLERWHNGRGRGR